MVYSVQQIKFEMISYVKEFGGDFTQWAVGRAEDAPKVLFEVYKIDPIQDVWLWKPALSPTAAAIVINWMTDRQNACSAPGDEHGNCVFMFKKCGLSP